MWTGRRDRPYPRLIFARDRGNMSSSSRDDSSRGSSRHGRGGGGWRGKGGGRWRGSRGRGGGSNRGGGPHVRFVGGVVPTTGLFHNWTGRGLEIFLWEEDLKE